MKKRIILLGLAASLSLSSLVFAGPAKDIDKKPEDRLVAEKDGLAIEGKLIEEDGAGLDIRMEIAQLSGLKDKKKEAAFNKKIEDEARESLAAFKKEAGKSEGEFLVNYYVKSKGPIISIVLEEYSSLKTMAQGSNKIRTYNILADSGDSLKLEDLFEDGKDYKTRLNSLVRKEMKKNPDIYFEEEFKGVDGDSKFFIDRELNLVLAYDQDEIAPHSTGLVKFKIDSKDIEDISLFSKSEEGQDYFNRDYDFGIRMSDLWNSRLEIVENGEVDQGLFRLDFIYKTIDEKLEDNKIFSILVRSLDDRNETDYELARGDYSYRLIYDAMKKNPYKEGTEDYENYREIVKSLDGIDDLFIVDSQVDFDSYVNEDYKFKFNIPGNWEDYVSLEEGEVSSDDLFRLDFIFKSSEENSKGERFFSILVRDGSKTGLTKNQLVLKEGDYTYIGDFRELDYPKDSQARKEYMMVSEALNGAEEMISLLVEDKNRLILNGEEIILKNPIYLNERGVRMLPLREIGEALGFEVSWDKENRLAKLDRLPVSLGAYIGREKNYYSRALVYLEDRSELKDGLSYVPETFFTEVLDGDLSLDDESILNLKY